MVLLRGLMCVCVCVCLRVRAGAAGTHGIMRSRQCCFNQVRKKTILHLSYDNHTYAEQQQKRQFKCQHLLSGAMDTQNMGEQKQNLTSIDVLSTAGTQSIGIWILCCSMYHQTQIGLSPEDV